jgi:translation initiation factor 3 subunit C
MPQDSWVSCRQEYDELISILLENRGYTIQEVMTEEYNDLDEREPKNAGDRVALPGSLIGVFENIDNEFTKTLQHTDPHERGADYIDRLKQAQPLYTTLVKAQCLFERENASDAVARIVIRRLEHVYSRPDVFVGIFERATQTACEGLQSTVSPIGGEIPSSAVLVHRLASFVYSSEAPLLRARAILMHIYHHAMHARYHQARDQLLMSHMQEAVQQADVTTQILYNRAVVQVGLAAFRCGYIAECQTILGEMMSTQRYRELLGQNIQRYNQQLTPEQELLEKRRLLPFHMHINHELLEAAYLTSCMLVEIPLMASVDTEEQRRRIASKTFKRLLDMAERSAFDGLPENNRDHVIKAARALQAGDWERSKELLLSAKIWNLFDKSAEIKEMLSK